MLKVKIHPNRHLSTAGVDKCISVTPVKKGARTYYMATVMLRDAKFVVHPSGVERAKEEGHRNVHAWVQGEVIHESEEVFEVDNPIILKSFKEVSYDLDTGRFMTVGKRPVDVTDKALSAVYAIKNKVYIKESK